MTSTKKTSPPFFLLGCVRSGTTMLRDLLREHPHLACAEETHFFRWGDPYGTEKYNSLLRSNPTLKRHREIDGIAEDEFIQMLHASTSRGDLQHRYMAEFVSRKKPSATRWFDKTPQNVYGALMIAAALPFAKFVHIIRDPVNVVASLRLGQVIKIERLVGAANYWNESVQIVGGLKLAYPGRVYELKYEDLVSEPQEGMRELLEFLNEPFDPAWFSFDALMRVDHRKDQILSDAEISRVAQLCSEGMRRYGY